MTAYTFGDYIFFDDIIDVPKEHYNQLALNKETRFYKTSLSNLMDKTLALLPKLFINEMMNLWMKSYNKVVSQLSKVIKCSKENQQMEPIYVAR